MTDQLTVATIPTCSAESRRTFIIQKKKPNTALSLPRKNDSRTFCTVFKLLNPFLFYAFATSVVSPVPVTVILITSIGGVLKL